jgi:hypothetical protein
MRGQCHERVLRREAAGTDNALQVVKLDSRIHKPGIVAMPDDVGAPRGVIR